GDQLARSLRAEAIAHEALAQPRRGEAAMGGEDEQALRLEQGDEQLEEAAPGLDTEVGEQRAAPDEIETIRDPHLVGACFGVHGHRTEGLRAEVDTITLDVAGGEARSRKRRLQVAQYPTMTARQVEDARHAVLSRSQHRRPDGEQRGAAHM